MQNVDVETPDIETEPKPKVKTTPSEASTRLAFFKNVRDKLLKKRPSIPNTITTSQQETTKKEAAALTDMANLTNVPQETAAEASARIAGMMKEAGAYKTPKSILQAPEIVKDNTEQLTMQMETMAFENSKHEIGGHKIDVYSKEFEPSSTKNPKPDDAVVFIPGWASGTGKNFEIVGQAFADEGGKKSFVVNSIEFNHIKQDRFEIEARALAQFIKAKGLKNATIVGNSEGGAKALNLVNVLQEQFPDVTIDGLVLLAPVGLYDQAAPLPLMKKFWMDEGKRFYSQQDIKEAPVKYRRTYRQRFANYDPVGFMDKEINQMPGPNWETGLLKALSGMENTPWVKSLNYVFTKLIPQVSDMGDEQTTAMRNIKCPVVLVQGRYDTVSDPKKVVGEAGMDDYKERVRVLKENFFPNSPDVSMMLPKRVGSHGVIHFRQEELAKISMYLLERVKRRNRPLQGATPSPEKINHKNASQETTPQEDATSPFEIVTENSGDTQEKAA